MTPSATSSQPPSGSLTGAPPLPACVYVCTRACACATVGMCVCAFSLALRVGNEKDEDEADTVGCCSLRVEHIAFPADGHVELNFLGKDSMPYHQVIGMCASPFLMRACACVTLRPCVCVCVCARPDPL